MGTSVWKLGKTMRRCVTFAVVVGMLVLMATGAWGTPSPPPPAAVSLDVHIVLDAKTNQVAEEADAYLHSVLPDDEVHLRTIDVPHVTLYLTSFLAKDVGTVVAKAGEVVAGFWELRGVPQRHGGVGCSRASSPTSPWPGTTRPLPRLLALPWTPSA